MQPTDDSVLLRQYVENHSDEAFAALVARHINLVYSVALRCVGDSHQAEEVAQAVFILLAKKAAQLRHDKALSSWLFQTTRLTASNFIRGETRRHRREQEAHMQSVLNDPESDVWPRIAPLLDDAVAGLNEKDRDAIVLRFYEGRSLREVGAVLGASEAAAEKRVSRAVERLREFFAKRGVTVGASGLVVVISANAVQAAPVGLAVTISTAAPLAGTIFVTTTTATIGKAIVMTTKQKALITLALVAFLATATYKAYRANQRPGRSEAAPNLELTTTQTGNGAKRFNPFGSANNRSNPRVAPDLAKLAADLRTALHDVPRSQYGTRSYPPESVVRALLNFGPDRKEAFVTLLEGANDPDLEVRKRAISAMGHVGMVSTPHLAQFGIVGDAAPEAKPFLWKVLQDQNPDLAHLALGSLRGIGFEPNEIPVLADMMSRATNDLMVRYLPQAIAQIIERDAAGAAPLISAVEVLLNHPDFGVQFEAACTLAKHEAAGNPQVLATLLAGLRSKSDLRQIMALETLQGIGSVAEPTLQAILDFANATGDKVIKDLALKTIGKIKNELRSDLPEVGQALKQDERNAERIANWNEKFASGSYTRQDLIDALKEPKFSVTAAKKLGEMGASAKETVPNLISALAGLDQPRREQIVEAIHQIDPQVTIVKVESRPIAIASKIAALTLAEKPNQRGTPLAELLEQSQGVNSDWRTQQELIALAKAIAAQDQDPYLAFVEQLLEEEPSLTNLFSKPAVK